MSDEKINHKVPMIALKAWGRVTTMVMQNYNHPVQRSTLQEASIHEESSSSTTNKRTIKEKVDELFKNTSRTPEWYRDNDEKIEKIVKSFCKLVTHQHPNVRLELLKTSELILKNCLMSMPKSARHFIQIIIIMTQDVEPPIRSRSKELLETLANTWSTEEMRTIFDYMEAEFIRTIYNLPSTFGGLDDGKKLASVNLIIGYLILYSKFELIDVLLNVTHLRNLVHALMSVSQLKNSADVFETKESGKIFYDPYEQVKWKQFVHYRNEAITTHIEKLCHLLGRNNGTFRTVVDFILDFFNIYRDNFKEAVLLMNAILTSCELNPENIDILKRVLFTYMDPTFFDVPLEVKTDHYTLAEIHNNIIQVCVLMEGVGCIATRLGLHFKSILQRVLPSVFEKAGNRQPYVSSIGVLVLKNISQACGYSDISALISSNIDYISFHLSHQQRATGKANLLPVISIILKHTRLDVLPYVSILIEDSINSFHENKQFTLSYLEVFNEFVLTLRSWLGIVTKVNDVKSREERYKEAEGFKVTGIEEQDDFSDEAVTRNSAEDMQKNQEELLKEVEVPEIAEYKKPKPPLYVRLLTDILCEALNFIPSKNNELRLKALEIFINGVEILQDWEDELLPIVHKVWSPLVDHFKEIDDPLVTNYSFKLLIILARVSKDFIRYRTTKEALPHILDLLEKLSRKSYMKDRGSPYRYTQTYKLQLAILKDIGHVLVDMDINEKHIGNVIEVLRLYMSNRQPAPLRELALKSVNMLFTYDSNAVSSKFNQCQTDFELHKTEYSD
ncbi:unnamed protein product [Acanthoscelides obtectus]|nr:unnamed protein product [Acanthoscelides obtectus]CAK1670643.1 TELO2-interacting protein 1 homolog [Acanthoscelides obtectus]